MNAKTNRTQCHGVTKSDKRCKNMTRNENGYCHLHQNVTQDMARIGAELVMRTPADNELEAAPRKETTIAKHEAGWMDRIIDACDTLEDTSDDEKLQWCAGQHPDAPCYTCPHGVECQGYESLERELEADYKDTCERRARNVMGSMTMDIVMTDTLFKTSLERSARMLRNGMGDQLGSDAAIKVAIHLLNEKRNETCDHYEHIDMATMVCKNCGIKIELRKVIDKPSKAAPRAGHKVLPKATESDMRKSNTRKTRVAKPKDRIAAKLAKKNKTPGSIDPNTFSIGKTLLDNRPTIGTTVVKKMGNGTWIVAAQTCGGRAGRVEELTMVEAYQVAIGLQSWKSKAGYPVHKIAIYKCIIDYPRNAHQVITIGERKNGK